MINVGAFAIKLANNCTLRGFFRRECCQIFITNMYGHYLPLRSTLRVCSNAIGEKSRQPTTRMLENDEKLLSPLFLHTSGTNGTRNYAFRKSTTLLFLTQLQLHSIVFFHPFNFHIAISRFSITRLDFFPCNILSRRTRFHEETLKNLKNGRIKLKFLV